MTLEELNEMLAILRDTGAESVSVEAKRAKKQLPGRLWETLSAFANTAGGGIILLGVDEGNNFDVVGIEDPPKLQSDLASLCDQMEPPLRPLIQVHSVDGRTVISAEVPEVDYKHKPCYYKGAGLIGGSFIRVADGNRRLTQYEIQVFMEARGQPTWDLEPVSGRAVGDLDQELISHFIRRLRAKPGAPYHNWGDNELLRTFRVVTVKENRLVPTLAGYLCFGTYPQDEFPGLYISVVRYPAPAKGGLGQPRERLLDNVKIEGSVTRMLVAALEAISRNLRQRTVVYGLLRHDVPEYPVEVLREAIVNALGHRDYSPLARGTPVQVRVFPDRLEVENPGGLFGPVTLERLGEPGIQAARNSYLMKLLEDLPVLDGQGVVSENRGTGITAMLSALRQAGMEPPKFYDLRTTFKVTVSNTALLDDETLQWFNELQGEYLSDAQRLALAYARRAGQLTNADYCRLNLVDSRVATRDLGELVRQGFFQQHGTRRWAYYTLAPTPLQPRQRKDRREDIVSLLKSRGPLARGEIAHALGLTDAAVHYWLRVLRREGRVQPTTRSPRAPSTKYILSPER